MGGAFGAGTHPTTRGDRVDVSVTIGTLHFAERGTIKVSAQAIVRQTASA